MIFLKLIVSILLIFFACPKVSHGMEISAKSACLIVAESGEIVYEKEPHLKLPMASTTKMMTALVAAESGLWDETVTVSVNAQNQEGSSIYLEENDKIKLCDLVSGMMLNSGNDAAVAAAEHISGNCESFAEKMTERAKKAGAVDTNFENPSGLDSDGHYTTAYDLALIGSEVIKNEYLKPIIKSKELQITNQDGDITYLKNHNKLLWSYEGMIGVKTGFTKKSGRCLVTAAKREDVTLVAVTLCDPCDWEDHKKMLDYGFEVCCTRTEIEKGSVLKTVTVGGSSVGLRAAESLNAVDVKGVREKREVKIMTVREPLPPVKAGEKMGEAQLFQNGRLIAKTDLVADRDVYADTKKNKSIFGFIRGLLGFGQASD